MGERKRNKRLAALGSFWSLLFLCCAQKYHLMALFVVLFLNRKCFNKKVSRVKMNSGAVPNSGHMAAVYQHETVGRGLHLK